MVNDNDIRDLVPSDFESIQLALRDYVNNNISPSVLQDPGTSSAGQALLDLLSYCTGLLRNNIDIQTRECLLSTARLGHQIENIALNRGYIRKRRSAATGTLRFEGTTAFTISQRFIVQNSSSGEYYITTQSGVAVDVGGGVFRVDLEGIHADQTIDVFTAQGVEHEEFILTQSNVIVDSSFKSASVSVDGITAKVVDSTLGSTATDRHFSWQVNHKNQVVLIGGDGIFGAKLTPGASVQITYYYGGGDVGNCAASAIDQLSSSLSGLDSVENTTAFTGGSDEESLTSTKKNARSRGCGAMLNSETYATELASLIGIAKAIAFPNVQSGLPPTVDIYAVPEGGSVGTLSASQISAIEQHHDRYGMIGCNINVYSGYAENVQIKVEVFCEEAANRSTVEDQIVEQLTNLLLFNNVDFTTNLYLQDVYSVIDQVEGVRRFEVKKCCLKPYILAQTSNVGNPTYSDVIIKGVTEDAWYHIANTSSVSFDATKRVPLNATSLTDEWVIDAGVDFTLEQGTPTSTETKSIDGNNSVSDTSKIWTTNEYQNYLLVDSSGNVFLIVSNTTNKLTLGDNAINLGVGNYDVDSGAYKIVRSFVGAALLTREGLTRTIIYNTHQKIGCFESGDVGADLLGILGKGKDFYIEIQQGSGTYGTPFITSDGLIAFTITAGATPSDSADIHSVYTSNLVDDVVFKRDGGLLQLPEGNIEITLFGGVA